MYVFIYVWNHNKSKVLHEELFSVREQRQHEEYFTAIENGTGRLGDQMYIHIYILYRMFNSIQTLIYLYLKNIKLSISCM
jgi:hypothetical protein